MIPAVPPDPFHPRGTVDSLPRLLPSATELPGCPEAPHPEFPPHLESFLGSVASFAGSAGLRRLPPGLGCREQFRDAALPRGRDLDAAGDDAAGDPLELEQPVGDRGAERS